MQSGWGGESSEAFSFYTGPSWLLGHAQNEAVLGCDRLDFVKQRQLLGIEGAEVNSQHAKNCPDFFWEGF